MLKKFCILAASAALSLAALAGLTLFPSEAAAAAVGGIELCLKTIIPSLFPFMAVGGLITELGLTARLSQALSPAMRRLFGVSGAGGGAFFLGLVGGYPLGAAAAAQLYKSGTIEKSEAERLLGFCDNTGPAFIIGVAGGAVFESPRVGLFLYAVHILCAVLTGMLLCWKDVSAVSPDVFRPTYKSLPVALTSSVKRAVSVCGAVCGFVVFFSVALGLLESSGILSAVVLSTARLTGLELRFLKSAAAGILELGAGIGSMKGLGVSALNLALCSFILGFGSLSVHAQAFSVIAEGGLSSARHLLGKLLHGGLSALVTLIAYFAVF